MEATKGLGGDMPLVPDPALLQNSPNGGREGGESRGNEEGTGESQERDRATP